MSGTASGRTVWCVLVGDRHTDVEPVIFTKKADAMVFALSVVGMYQARGCDIENYGDATETTVRGWACGAEGDYVSVQPCVLDDPPEVPA